MNNSMEVNMVTLEVGFPGHNDKGGAFWTLDGDREGINRILDYLRSFLTAVPDGKITITKS